MMDFIKILWKYINYILSICSAIPGIPFLYGIIIKKIQDPFVISLGIALLIYLPFFIYIFIQERKIKEKDEMFKTFVDRFKNFIEAFENRDNFSYILKDGNWIPNFCPDAKNAALRAESIQIILENISCKGGGFSYNLREIGRKVAENYIEEVLKKYLANTLKEKENPNAKELIRIWLNLEYLSGWGKIEIGDYKDIPTNTRIAMFDGKISITNSFLSYKRKNKIRKLCLFLCGYMETIITFLAGFNVHVIETQCACDNDSDKPCLFDFYSYPSNKAVRTPKVVSAKVSGKRKGGNAKVPVTSNA